jgi:hypothetical protein
MIDDYTIRIDALMVLRVNKMDNVSVACIVDGYPLPKTTWKYNLMNIQYVEIKNFTEVGFPTNRTVLLSLYNIDIHNNGTYICTSDDGKKFDRIEIIVQCKNQKKIEDFKDFKSLFVFSPFFQSKTITAYNIEFIQ